MSEQAATAAAAAQAEQYKAEGNKMFAAKRYGDAVSWYTKAIDAQPSEVLYSNRAFAHLRLENFGSAIEDANKALELNPKFIKAYYRRGSAYLALSKFSLGLRDLKQVVAIVPGDKDAETKLREAEKAVRRIKFEAAIASEKTQPVSETIDLSTMAVAADYDGERLGHVITVEFVEDMKRRFKEQKLIARPYAYRILLEALTVLKQQPNVVQFDVPQGTHVTVCGDIHGQYYDLLNIFELNGVPSEANPYLFNGDFVDRGSFSVECLLTLMAYKWLYPDHMLLTRGNHESQNLTQMYGFAGEMKHKYEDRMLLLSLEVFQALPLATVIGGRVFCVHGGLFSQDDVTMEDLAKINRFQEIPGDGLMCEMLWSDPQAAPGRAPSKRGVALQFGPDVTERFLARNGFDLVVRSHEVKDEGYEVECNGKLITVFSAPNYCDQVGNKGAFIRFEADLKPRFRSFAAVYAGNPLMSLMS